MDSVYPVPFLRQFLMSFFSEFWLFERGLLKTDECNEKEWIIDTCNSMDESQINYAEWKKLDTKYYIP